MMSQEIKKYCACGCGKEVKVWKNGISSPFLRGHHMRKQGFKEKPEGPHYCRCGCGTEILPNPVNGHVNKFVKGHHLKGKELDFEYRLERTRKRWGREPTISPYLKETFISFDKTSQRWYACVKWSDGKQRGILHANAVYRHYHGEIPEGYVVHHKNGRHDRIEDDRPENLMLLPDEWNLRFLPVLAKGFGVKEKVVTDCYMEVKKDQPSRMVFSDLCRLLMAINDLNAR
jgi:hypothetical protein